MMKLSTSKTAATAASRFVSPSQLRVNQAVSKLAAGQQQAARTKATVAAPSIKSAQDQALRYAKYGGLALGLGLAQYQFGTADDFFEHKFTTNKNACDLADFYGTEDFMEVFCVFPFMVSFMMRQAVFDDEGNIHAWGISGPGQLKVTIEFDEEESDTDGDGEPDTITYFNKRETFCDKLPNWLKPVFPFLADKAVWEMTQNFGYRMKDDGSCEITHNGEHFSGFFPMRFLFQMHARYVIWATERYVNSDEFGAEDGERAEEMRQNIPLREFQLFIDGLTRQVETAKEDADEDKKRELEVTLQRLQTVSGMDHTKIRPRLMTLRSHKTNLESVHLMVNDKEAKDTIQKAMEQIGSSAGKRQEPLKEMRNLSRRTTLANDRSK